MWTVLPEWDECVCDCVCVCVCVCACVCVQAGVLAEGSLKKVDFQGGEDHLC